MHLLAQQPARVATLCAAHVWQCEADAVLVQKRVLSRAQRMALSAGVLAPRALNWSLAFSVWQPFWHRTARVRLIKSPAFGGAAAALSEAARSQRLRLAFLILTRSPCTLNCKPRALPPYVHIYP